MEGNNLEEKKAEIKPYPRIKNAILLCVLLIVLQIVAGAVLEIVLTLTGLGDNSLINGIGLILISLLSFGIVIFIGFKKTGKNFNEVFKFNNVPVNIMVAIIVFMFGFIILSSELDNLVNLILPMPEFVQELFTSMIANEYLFVSIILVGIIPAFVEELMFRGIILDGLKDNYSVKKAIIISSLLFGLIHLNPWQFVSAFLIGLISAWICVKVNSIWPSIYMHFFNNMLFVIIMEQDKILIRGFNSSYTEHSFQPLWFTMLGVVLAGIGVLLLINALYKKKTA